MTRNELIGAVSLDFIKALVEQEPVGTLRYCMLGLEASLVRSIAEAVFADTEANATVAVRLSSAFDANRGLPEEARSDQSITHWRHCQLPKGKERYFLQRRRKSCNATTKAWRRSRKSRRTRCALDTMHGLTKQV